MFRSWVFVEIMTALLIVAAPAQAQAVSLPSRSTERQELGSAHGPGGTAPLAAETHRVPLETGALQIEVMRPRGSGLRPAVLILHGTHGYAREYRALAGAFADAGLVGVAACWFRGGEGAGRRFVTPLDCPADTPGIVDAGSVVAGARVDALVDAVMSLPGVDPSRVVILGHSRGGGAARNHVLRGSRARAIVLNASGHPPEVIASLAQLRTPTLILQGEGDSPADGGSEMTSVSRARAFEAAARQVGAPVEARYFPGAGHNALFQDATVRREVIERTVAFLLGLPAAPLERAPTVVHPRPMTPRDVLAETVRPADRLVRYGEAESQFGELRLPAGPGPHPVVVLIHGGCWSLPAGVSFMAPMADALRAEGVATWNIEYRHLPEPGSGWPGTYQDVGRAVDFLRELAPQHALDLTRVVLVGHSAGGHLAHWAAGRSRLGPDSALRSADPLMPAGVINLAGRMDMTADVGLYEEKCRGPVVRSFVGGTPLELPERYAELSPQALVPLGVRQIMIWGEFEDFVPRASLDDYLGRAQAAGDDVQAIFVPGAGHFDSASPTSSAWPYVRSAIWDLLRRGSSDGQVSADLPR